MPPPGAELIIPNWAVSVFVAAFIAVLGVAWWGLRWIATRIREDIDGIGENLKTTGSELGKKLDGANSDIRRVATMVGHVDRRLLVVEERVTPGRERPEREVSPSVDDTWAGEL